MTGYLTALAFALESDRLTAAMAYNNGIVLVRSVPRLLITSFAATGEPAAEVRTAVSLDLRLDEVAGYPYPGLPGRATEHFQLARGLLQASLEGRVLARVVPEGEVLTATRILTDARRQGGDILLIRPDEPSRLETVGALCNRSARRIREALDQGLEVMLPTLPGRGLGREIWGWWQRDPVTGIVTAVLDTGEHQAIVEYQIKQSDIAMDDDTSYALGMLKGSESTTWLVMGKILEYGEVTAQLIAEVEAELKKVIEAITCGFCPKIELKLEPEINIGTEGCWQLTAGRRGGSWFRRQRRFLFQFPGWRQVLHGDATRCPQGRARTPCPYLLGERGHRM